MRSVHIFMLDVPSEELMEFLDELGNRNAHGDWVVGAEEPVAWIGIVDYWEDLEPEDVAATAMKLGAAPTLRVQIDVSGRIPGVVQARSLSLALLDRFGGVALDDNSECPWVADEIRLDAEAKRPRFFTGGDVA